METSETGGVENAIEKLTCKKCYKINTVACHVGFL